MTAQGVVRGRSIKRKPETEAWTWNAEQFRLGVGLPWQPQPTQEINAEVLPYKLAIPVDKEEVREIQQEAAEARPEEPISVPRKVYIRTDIELEKYCFTRGCPGCDRIAALRRGDPLVSKARINHSNACRNRTQKEMEEDEAGRQRLEERRLRRGKQKTQGRKH